MTFELVHFTSQAQCALLVRLFPGEHWAEVMWQAAFDDKALQAFRERQVQRTLEHEGDDEIKAFFGENHE